MNNSKRGNSAVFLTLILAALMSITLALIYGVRQESVNSRIDGIVNLAGDSVMSEFNYEIQKEYGLFLLKGTDKTLEKKLRNYINYSLKYMDKTTLEAVTVSGGQYCVADSNRVKEQILEHMKYAKAEGVIKNMYSVGRTTTLQDDNNMVSRTLRNGPTIVSLPSKNMSKTGSTSFGEYLADKGEGVEAAFEAGTDKYLIDGYIFGHFNSRVKAVNSEHFFKNEVEYVIGGEVSDIKNEKRVEMILKAMRFPLNLVHIYTNPEKRTAVIAAAELLTPGPAAAATQAALAATWAYAESDNDVELLLQGYKVPVTKTGLNWAIDLDSATEGLLGGTVKPQVEKGFNYEQYLKILLYFKDEDTTVARVMDLIQINTRKQYDGDFLIQEYWTGISINVKVNGESFGYEKKY